MFLQPQHFQQQDRYIAHALAARTRLAVPYQWGFYALGLDETALLQGQLALTRAVGVLRDGTHFSIPTDDPAPPALDVPADTRDECVVLALPQLRPGVAESDVEGPSALMPARYHAVDLEVADSHASSLRQAPLQIGRLNLRLMLERDVTEGYSYLAVARIVERRTDGRLVLDTQHIPPLLHVAENVVLEGFVREVFGLIHQRADALAARLAQPDRAGVGEIVDFLWLQICNRYEPQLLHLRQCSVLHPERVYTLLLSLAGDMSTFRDSKRPIQYPNYDHDNLDRCLGAVMADLRQSLSIVREQSAIPIELQERKYGIRVAIIPDLELQRTASFVLAVSAQIPGEQLRARFPAQAKIGPAERIRDLVNLQLMGVNLRPLQVAPRQIPFHAGFCYFELETRGNEMWRQLETSGGLAMHISGEFPGLELEFWAIR